ncbi:hypothetical protein BM526_19000 (plasmid) [Alteromonas mediterranea]|uniref:hypothetical protein n=1 Tax=Alteromonas mediterranea TaxID=314275 RepID=UPI000903C5B9|nr:hypothetical protein [Alteromonas mediterranea]APE04059.1 hypothetical protein BM526_19000 [Alteromonas mediterranea]
MTKQEQRKRKNVNVAQNQSDDEEEYIDPVSDQEQEIIDAAYLPEGLIEVNKKDIVNTFSGKVKLKIKGMLNSTKIQKYFSYLLMFFSVNYLSMYVYESTTDNDFMLSNAGIRILGAMIVTGALGIFLFRKSRE